MSKIKSKSIKKSRNGFTLIELIIVIAILGILSSIVVPRLSGFSEKARIKADQVSLSTLNKATSMYAALNNKNDDDIFAGVTPDEDGERMGVLIDEGLLDKKIKAQQKGASFVWKKDVQLWAMSDSGESSSIGPDTGLSMTEDEAKAAKFTFKELEGSYIITGYTGSDKDLVIPSKINGVTVTEIGNDAFRDFNGKKLTSIKLPNTVTKIGERAFWKNELTSLTLPDGLKEIGHGAFTDNKLTSLTLPDGLTEIGSNAFIKNNLTSIKLPDELTKIGTDAFSNNELTSITIPDKVTEIGSYAFKNNKLESVEIGNSVETIYLGAFSTNRLTKVKIPDSAKKIDPYAFNYNGEKGEDYGGVPKGEQYWGNSLSPGEWELTKTAKWEHLVWVKKQ